MCVCVFMLSEPKIFCLQDARMNPSYCCADSSVCVCMLGASLIQYVNIGIIVGNPSCLLAQGSVKPDLIHPDHPLPELGLVLNKPLYPTKRTLGVNTDLILHRRLLANRLIKLDSDAPSCVRARRNGPQINQMK